MFTDVIDEQTGLDDAALDARIRRLEVERRRNAAEQAAAIAVAERRGLHSVDGLHSMKGYLRATCNWSSSEAGQARRLARLVDTVPDTGQRLLDGRIGIGQADELARARANPRCGDELAHVAPCCSITPNCCRSTICGSASGGGRRSPISTALTAIVSDRSPTAPRRSTRSGSASTSGWRAATRSPPPS